MNAVPRRRTPRDKVLVPRIIASPVGPLRIIASTKGIRAILWPDDTDRVPNVEPNATIYDATDANVDVHLDAAHDQLDEYFAGVRTEFDVALDPVGTDFQRSAWDALRTIPFGETVSYGEQAERLGDPNKARAVGAANGKNPISIIVPCHRVVGSNGAMTGFAGGVDTKQFLLAHEQRVAGNTLL